MSWFTILLILLAAAAAAGEPGRGSGSDWWKNTIVYQIYPRSFQDSNDDGVGDIKGIIKRLDYFNYLNVDTIWLSPIYRSPMIDFGYDVEDFVDIDPLFGTLDDFDELIRQAHTRGINVMMDFIPNHSSNRHRWFVESRKGGTDNLYSDYYVWHDGKLLDNGTRALPNNWRSCFTGPAWTWDAGRNQYYFHQFDPSQPDLNYRNPRVRQEMKNVLKFWLDRGVDGFRVDAIATVFEIENVYLNEPVKEGVPSYDEDSLDHIYTRNLPEVYELVGQWRQLFDEHDAQTGRHTYMVVEVYLADEKTMKYYAAGADMPFNFEFISVDENCYANCIRKLINNWMSALPAGKWPNFVTGNHDRKRISTRKGEKYVDAMNVLLLTLPGTATTYYGEELGMSDIDVSYEDTQDPWGKNLGPELYKVSSRDPCRAPMQWDSSKNAGFSSAPKTWLPVNPDYVQRNVQAQNASDQTPLFVYRTVARMRKERDAFHTDDVLFIPGDDDVIAYVRYDADNDGSPSYLIAINVGRAESHGIGVRSVKVLDVEYVQGNVDLSSSSEELGRLMMLEDIALNVGDFIIVQLVQQLEHGKQEL